MELTVNQTLTQGNAAFNQGKLQEAERLYRAVLKVQPKHPGANHNLGLIAVSMSQSDVALPLFKKAIGVNPNVEQYWLSYIEALIKEDASVSKFLPYHLPPTSEGLLAATSPENASLT